ncbi:MAG: SAM-dependent methyltransferase, partial [Chloroflexi bacterium]|nr:SAM-dependent methyltransferase [Chloroflexota bacterium]
MEPPERQIREEIHREGRITFARFMELALFSRSGGYYSSPRAETPYRDYFTSPGAHPLFGHLLALQLEELWQLLGRPHPFTVIEPGSGTGILAGDILRSAGEMSEKFAQSLRYICIDRFPPEAGVQRTASEKGQHVIAETMPFKDVTGCILSNELLDSFPVHRFQIQEGRAWEVYVTVQGDGLAEVLDEPSTPELAARLEAVAPLLP